MAEVIILVAVVWAGAVVYWVLRFVYLILYYLFVEEPRIRRTARALGVSYYEARLELEKERRREVSRRMREYRRTAR